MTVTELVKQQGELAGKLQFAEWKRRFEEGQNMNDSDVRTGIHEEPELRKVNQWARRTCRAVQRAGGQYKALGETYHRERLLAYQNLRQDYDRMLRLLRQDA